MHNFLIIVVFFQKKSLYIRKIIKNSKKNKKMNCNLKNFSRKLLLPVVFAVFTANSYAGGVTGWSATDGFSTLPVARKDFVIDARFNAVVPFKSGLEKGFQPTLNLVYGLTDFMEVGVGTGLNFYSPAREEELSVQSVYPWIRVYVPFKPDSIAKVRFGFMMGALIPVWNSATPAQPGVSGLLDIKLKNGTFGINAGYSRTIPETIDPENPVAGSNVVSANLNHAITFKKFSIYEEAFVNHFVKGDPNGGFRFSMYFPFMNNKIIFDVNPAVLWYNVGEETDWYFNPNVGATFTF